MKDEFNSWLKERYRAIAADFCKAMAGSGSTKPSARTTSMSVQ
jgi:hypothetical protein